LVYFPSFSVFDRSPVIRVPQSIMILLPMVIISVATGLLIEPSRGANGTNYGGKPMSSGVKTYSILVTKVIPLHSMYARQTLNIFPGINHGIAQDGRVAILTVHRLMSNQSHLSFKVVLDYFDFPYHRIYTSSVTAFLVDLIHVFMLAFEP
jgi:hypothetical protein